jgi:hypothetical protein
MAGGPEGRSAGMFNVQPSNSAKDMECENRRGASLRVHSVPEFRESSQESQMVHVVRHWRRYTLGKVIADAFGAREQEQGTSCATIEDESEMKGGKRVIFISTHVSGRIPRRLSWGS